MSLRFRFLLLSVSCVVVLVIVILWNVDRWATQRFAANAQLFGEIVTQTQLDPEHGLEALQHAHRDHERLARARHLVERRKLSTAAREAKRASAA